MENKEQSNLTLPNKVMTNDLRSVIFQQYHGQYVNSSMGRCRLRDSDFIDRLEWIELTALSNITNRDAIEVCKILYPEYGNVGYYNWAEYGKFYIKHVFCDRVRGAMKVEVYQYLQSKGYALPFREWSVDDLVKAGIYKMGS